MSLARVQHRPSDDHGYRSLIVESRCCARVVIIAGRGRGRHRGAGSPVSVSAAPEPVVPVGFWKFWPRCLIRERLPVRRPESLGTGTRPAAAARWPKVGNARRSPAAASSIAPSIGHRLDARAVGMLAEQLDDRPVKGSDWRSRSLTTIFAGLGHSACHCAVDAVYSSR